jgi:hypothetical protein
MNFPEVKISGNLLSRVLVIALDRVDYLVDVICSGLFKFGWDSLVSMSFLYEWYLIVCSGFELDLGWFFVVKLRIGRLSLF